MSYRLSPHALCKHYSERNVVDNIDLTIVSGEIIGIL
jgi:ABC-type lipopolysaccharide export system ATPase subunit